MVRIGGGWDTLESYLDRHDPCRCNSKRKHLILRQFILEDEHGTRLCIMWRIRYLLHYIYGQNTQIYFKPEFSPRPC